MSEPHSVAVTEQNNALRKAIREDWEEGFEIARRVSQQHVGIWALNDFDWWRVLRALKAAE